MSTYRKIPLTVNIDTGYLIDPLDGARISNEKLPAFCYGETAILCLSFVDSELNAFSFNSDDLFEFAMDSDFVHESDGAEDPLMAYSANDMVDISGDWASISRNDGNISIRIDCFTEGFLAKIDNDEEMDVWFEVKRYISGSSYPSEILRDKGYARNVLKTTEGAPASADPEYYNAVQTDSLLSAKADASHTHDTYIAKVSNLSDLPNISTARTNLGLGDSAILDVGTASDEVAAGNHTHSELHSHSNKTLLDTYTQTETNLASAVSNNHTHSNKTSLDAIPDHSTASTGQVIKKQSDGSLAFEDETGAVSSVFGKTGDVANISDTAGYLYNDGSGNFSYTSPSGSGDVSGPSSSTDGNVVTFNGTTGKVIKDSGLALSGSNTGDETTSTIQSKLGTASTSADGYLTSTDWNTFNGKQSAITASGILKGNGSSVSAATSGTDYAPATSGTSILYGNGSGGFSSVTIGDNLTFSSGTLSASGGGSGSTSDTSWTGANWTSTTASPSQRAVEEALDNVGVDTLANTLTASDNGRLKKAYCAGMSFGDTTIDALSSSLVAAYKFSNGALTTDSANTYTLTNVSSVTSYASGKSGYCAEFSGANYFTMTWPSQTHPSFFCSGWINLSSTGAKVILSIESSANNYVMHLSLTSSTILHCDVNNSSGTYFTADGTTVLSTSTWYHVAAYFDGSYTYIYLNGALEATSSTAFSGTLNTAGKWAIGARAEDGIQKFAGYIDELYYWRGSSALFSSTGDALSVAGLLYNSGSGKFYGDDVVRKYTLSTVKDTDINFGSCQGRLTLSTGVPVPSSDVTAASALYFTPYNGNKVSLYYNSAWLLASFTETSLSISSLTASTNYDIFGYYTGSALALEALAWTDATTRATALTTQDGIYVKSGDTTRRYLGTIRITATTGQCEDSESKRFVWNMYNRVNRLGKTRNTNGTWTYTTATAREYNGGTGQVRAEFILGLVSDVMLYQNYSVISSTSAEVYIGIGIDTTTSTYASTRFSSGGLVKAIINPYPVPSVTIGYHYATQIEYGGTGFNNYGDWAFDTIIIQN